MSEWNDENIIKGLEAVKKNSGKPGLGAVTGFLDSVGDTMSSLEDGWAFLENLKVNGLVSKETTACEIYFEITDEGKQKLNPTPVPQSGSCRGIMITLTEPGCQGGEPTPINVIGLSLTEEDQTQCCYMSLLDKVDGDPVARALSITALDMDQVAAEWLRLRGVGFQPTTEEVEAAGRGAPEVENTG